MTKRKDARPEYCKGGCGRRLVRLAKDVVDPDKETLHYGKGFCSRCTWRKNRGRDSGAPRVRMRRPERCVNPECGKKMRARSDLDESNGAKYGGRGLCHPCWSKDDRAYKKLLKEMGMI